MLLVGKALHKRYSNRCGDHEAVEGFTALEAGNNGSAKGDFTSNANLIRQGCCRVVLEKAHFTGF